MNGFRINTGIKRIEVNDAGECIELQLGDATLFSRICEFMDEIQQKYDNLIADVAWKIKKRSGAPL